MNSRSLVQSEPVPSIVTGVAAHRVLDRWEALGLPMDSASAPADADAQAPIAQMQDLAEKLYGRRPPAELMARLWAENVLGVLGPLASKAWVQRRCERWASCHRSLLWHMGSEWRQMEIQHAKLSEATAWRRAGMMAVGAAIGFYLSWSGGCLLAGLALWPAAWGLHHAAMRRGLTGLPTPTEQEAERWFDAWVQAAETVGEKMLPASDH